MLDLSNSDLGWVAITIQLIAGAIFIAAPLFLWLYRRRREDLPEPRMLWLAAGFVCLVGLGHLIDTFQQLTTQNGAIADGLRVLTVLTSLAALGFVVPATRRLLSLPSRRLLQETNRKLLMQIERAERATQTVSLSEARYRLLVETAGEGIVILDRFGRLTFANARLAELLSIPVDDLTGKSILDLAPDEEKAAMIDSIARHRRGLAERRTARLLRADGSTVPVKLTSSPIVDRHEITGVLCVVTDLSEQVAVREQLEQLTADLEDRVQQRTESYRQVADRLSQTLELSRHQSRTYGMLQAMGEMLQACTSPLEGARVASQFAQTLFDADAGAIFVVEEGDDPRRPGYRALYQWGPPSECDDHIHAEDCWALRKAKPYPLSEEEEEIRCQHLRLNPTRHGLCLPLNAQGRVLGLINLRGVSRLLPDSSELGDHQLKLAQMFASKTAQFLANLTLRQRLEEQSLRDPLTSLFNRRYFSEQMNIEFQRALRAKTPLAALMIDVDHFKRINDRFGHETGDRVLKAIAEILSQNARAGDIVCRWGGEEFVILMPGSNGQAARRRADEIRNRIKDQIDVIGGARVSVSIGVAAYPEHACDPDGLIEVSDRALYAAKGAGRNRVTVAVAGV